MAVTDHICRDILNELFKSGNLRPKVAADGTRIARSILVRWDISVLICRYLTVWFQEKERIYRIFKRHFGEHAYDSQRHFAGIFQSIGREEYEDLGLQGLSDKELEHFVVSEVRWAKIFFSCSLFSLPSLILLRAVCCLVCPQTYLE